MNDIRNAMKTTPQSPKYSLNSGNMEILKNKGNLNIDALVKDGII